MKPNDLLLGFLDLTTLIVTARKIKPIFQSCKVNLSEGVLASLPLLSSIQLFQVYHDKGLLQIEVFPSSSCRDEKIRKKSLQRYHPVLREIFLYPPKGTNFLVKIYRYTDYRSRLYRQISVHIFFFLDFGKREQGMYP